MAVKENVLNNPFLVTESDYLKFLTSAGRGWVFVINDKITAFSIVDTTSNNVWALFVDPFHEKKGIGQKLEYAMLKWFFEQSTENLWLSTAPGTRAEMFYKASGWKVTGITNNGEVRFEMSYKDWNNLTSNK